MPKMIRPRSLVLVAVIVALALVPIVAADQYQLHVAIVVLYNVILATSLRLPFKTHQLNMGHVAFMGIGAYASTLLVMRLNVSFWLALPAAGIAAGLVAVLIGLPTLRIKGLQFVICTIAFGQIMTLVWIEFPVFGGVTGIVKIPPPHPLVVPGLFTVDFDSKTGMYYLALVLMILTLWILWRIDHSRLGRVLEAIGKKDVLCEAVGVNLMYYKMVAFCVSAFFAGLVGSFFAHYYYSISPGNFELTYFMTVMTYTVVGGLGSVFGPVAGTVLLVVMGEVMRVFGKFDPFVMGALLIAVMLFAREGLAGLPRRLPGVIRRESEEGDLAEANQVVKSAKIPAVVE